MGSHHRVDRRPKPCPPQPTQHTQSSKSIVSVASSLSAYTVLSLATLFLAVWMGSSLAPPSLHGFFCCQGIILFSTQSNIGVVPCQPPHKWLNVRDPLEWAHRRRRQAKPGPKRTASRLWLLRAARPRPPVSPSSSAVPFVISAPAFLLAAVRACLLRCGLAFFFSFSPSSPTELVSIILIVTHKAVRVRLLCNASVRARAFVL